MKRFLTSFLHFAPDNGSGMHRLWTDNGPMKSRKLFAVLTLLLFVGIGNAWGAEGDTHYTLQMSDYYSGTKPSGYASTGNVVFGTSSNQKTWNIPGNATLGSFFGIGGNNTSNTVRTMYSVSSIGTTTIGKVRVTTGGTGGNGTITFSKLVLEVSSNSDFAAEHIIDTKTNNSPAINNTNDFTPTAPLTSWPAGSYYRFKYTYKNSQSSKNGYFKVNSITFYEGAPECTGTTLDAPEVSVVPSSNRLTLSWPNDANADSYTVTCKVKSTGVAAGSIGAVTGTDTKTCAITTLTNGTEYTWSVTAVGDGTTYCTSDATEGSMLAGTSYTVTWMVNGESYETTYVYSGGNKNLVFPTAPSSCDAKRVFVGWTATNIGSSETDTPPTFVTSGTTINANQTYYAVFAKRGRFNRITGPSSLLAGQLIVIAGNKYSSVITTGIGYATPPTEQSDTLTNASTTEAMMWLLTGNSSSGWTISKIDNGYLLGYASNPGSNSSTPATLASYNTKSTWKIGQNSYTSNVLYISNWSSNACALEPPSASANWVVYNTSSYSSNQYTALKVYASTLTKFVTQCCTQLGSINGSINMSSSTDGTVTVSGWTYNAGSTGTTESNVSSYTVKLYKWNGSAWAIANASSTTGGSSGTAATRTGIATDSKSVTYSGLEYGGTYKFTVQAIGNGSSYCNGEETAVTSINGNSLTDNKFLNKYYFHIDDGTQSDTGWENHYLASINASHVGTVNVTLTQDVDYYQYKLTLGGVIWWGNTGKMTSANHSGWTFTTGASNCKLQTSLGGTYTFSATVTTPSVTVTYPTANQASGKKIWFDKSVITGWTDADASQLYWRIGKPSHTTVNSDETANYFSLVPGTDRFYVYETKGYDGFEAWHIANNTAWSGSSDNNPDYDNHGIYTHYHNQSSTDVTRATVYQKYVVGNDGVTLVPTTKKNTDWYCDFWNVDKTDGMLTHNVVVSTAAHGTLVATYTNTSGTTGQTVTEGNDADLAHRCILTITATPDDGYTCTSLTLNGDAFTSGNTHILTADATIAATFTANKYDVTLKPTSQTGSVTDQVVQATYDAAMPTTVKTAGTAIVIPERTGYSFTGWFDNSSGGKQYYQYTGSPKTLSSANAWDKTSATNLYAQWSINSYTLTWATVRGKVTTAGTGADVNATGNVSSSQEYNTPLTAPECGNANGYTFTGWSPDVADNMPAANTTYTAQWSANVYTVTLDNQSATTAGAASVSATFGQAMPSIASNLPAKTGYRFDGYYTAKNGEGTKYYNADGSSATNMAMYGANPKLYANWVAQLTFSVNGAIDGTLTRDVTESLPSSATVPTSCGDCWAFMGWSTDAEEDGAPAYAGGDTHEFGSPTTLYAVFGKAEYKLISDLSDLEANEYYVLSALNSNEFAMSNTTTDTYYATSVDITSDLKENADGWYLYNPPVSVIWKFTGTISSGRLYNEAASKYLDLSSNSATILQSSTLDYLKFTKFDSELFNIASTTQTSYFLYMYSGNKWSVDNEHDGYSSCYIYKRQSATYATEPNCETYDIVWKVDGTPLATGSQTKETNTCAGIEELPEDPDDDVLDCAPKFVGWSEEELVGVGHDAPADLFTSVGYAPAVEEDKIFHAVFATGTPIANTYVLGTIDDLKDGQTVILVNYANNAACKNTTSSTGTLDALDVSSLIDDDVLTTDNTAVKWTVTKSGDYYVFKSGDNYLRSSGASSLICDGTSDKWSISSGSVDGTYYLTSYNGSNKFEYYSSKFTTYGGTGAAYNTVFYIPAESYSDYMTMCCDYIVTLSDGSPSNGSVTFDPVGPIETCTAAKEVSMTITPDPGYYLSAWTSSGVAPSSVEPAVITNTANAQTTTVTFAKETTEGTYTAGATFSAKALEGWTWMYKKDADAADGSVDPYDIPDVVDLYIDQYARFIITGYTPSDVIDAKKGFVYTSSDDPAVMQPVIDKSKITYVSKDANNTYYQVKGKAATESTTITIKATGDGSITKTITIRVKALPLAHFVDNVHNVDFDDVVATATTGVVTLTKKTPTHDDVSDPGSDHNTCERKHLHLIGWIDGEWSPYSAYMNGTGDKPSITAITGATGYFYAPNADIDLVAKNGHTYYAVWAQVE